MVRSRAALAVGLFLVLAAFAYGTEARTSATVAGSPMDCGPAISASWLVAGTPDTTPAACDPAVQRARSGVVAVMGAGALLALVGWSAHRESRARPGSTRPRVAADR